MLFCIVTETEKYLAQNIVQKMWRTLTVAVESLISEVVKIPTQVNFQSPSCTCPYCMDSDAIPMQALLFRVSLTLPSMDLELSTKLLPYLTSPCLSLDQQSIDNTISDPLLASDNGLGLDQDIHNEEKDLQHCQVHERCRLHVA